MTTRPMLNYYGGKWTAANWIISYFPDHEIYVEVFGGGASILLKKNRSKMEIINDIDDEIVNLYRVMRDDFESLEKLLKLTPHSRTEYLNAYKNISDPVERARRSIVKSYFGIGDSQFHKGNGMRTSKTSGTCVAKSWQSYIKHSWEICDRFQGVTIEKLDFLDIIKKYDSPNTLFYLDPPYVLNTRSDCHGYRHDFEDKDHVTLLSSIDNLLGMAILSGYDSDNYNDLSWNKVKADFKTQKHNFKTECLWLSPNTLKASKQLKLL